MIRPVCDFLSNNVSRNFTAGFLAAYGLVSFFCFMFLEQKWRDLAPKAPNAVLGFIYQHNNHGSYTYFSAFQTTTCALLFMTSIPVCFAAIDFAPKKNLKFSSGKASLSWTCESDDPMAIRWKAAFVGALMTPIFLFVPGPRIIEMLNSVGIVINMG